MLQRQYVLCAVVHPFTLTPLELVMNPFTLFLARVLSCTDRPFGGGVVATGYDGGGLMGRALVEGAATGQRTP
jgi:hypothetical protein